MHFTRNFPENQVERNNKYRFVLEEEEKIERLTERTTCGVANLTYPQSCYFQDETKDQVAASAYRQLAIERLAAYEDAGMEPEQVLELKSFIQGGIHKVDDGWKHVQDLLQAEQDGRLVVLPKVAEADWKAFVDDLHDYFIESKFEDRSVGIFGMTDGEIALADALMKALAREETEAPLKGGDG